MPRVETGGWISFVEYCKDTGVWLEFCQNLIAAEMISKKKVTLAIFGEELEESGS